MCRLRTFHSVCFICGMNIARYSYLKLSESHDVSSLDVVIHSFLVGIDQKLKIPGMICPTNWLGVI